MCPNTSETEVEINHANYCCAHGGVGGDALGGLPPFHLHMDRGFAPNASYHVDAKAGKGGTTNSFKGHIVP